MDDTTAIEQAMPPRNVGEVERWISGLAGGMLVLRGLTKRSLTGVAMAFAGGWLLDRGLTGRCETYEKLGIDTTEAGSPSSEAEHPRTQAERARAPRPPVTDESGERFAERAEAYDEVEEASDESFPASDSPSWTPDSHLGGPPPDREATRRDRASDEEGAGED